MQTQARNDEPPPGRQPRIRFGLSGKLLMLTVLFVMLAEVCIYVPSIANFRLTWLNDKLVRGPHGGAGVRGGPPRCRRACRSRSSTASGRARSP